MEFSDDEEENEITIEENVLQQDNKYYITIPFKNSDDGFLYDLAISNRGFFKHPIDDVIDYIRNYSVNYIPETSKLEIVQTKYCYYKDFYLANVLIKTFWLKIIQRRWRNVLKKRKSFINTYYKQLKYIELTGRPNVKMPGLRGCLSDMKKIQ